MSVKKHREFFRYLISHILVLCIPLLVLGIAIHAHFMRVYIDSVLNEKALRTEAIKTTLDIHVHQLQNFSTQLAYNRSFSRSNVLYNPTAYLSIMRELSYFLLLNPNVSEIIYHIPGHDQFFLRRGTINSYFMFNTMMPYENLISGLEAPLWLKSQNMLVNPGNVVTFITPNPINGSIVMFQMNPEFFDGLFSGHSLATATVVLHGDNIIYTYDAEAYDHALLSTAAALAGTAEFTQIQLAGQPYYVYRTMELGTSFSLMMIVPASAIASRVNQAYLIYILCTVFIIIVGAFIIYWSIKVNYRPLKKMGDIVRRGRIHIPEHMPLMESLEFAVENYVNTPV